MKKYFLHITSWAGYAPGATHYYGRIHGEFRDYVKRNKYDLGFTREEYDVEHDATGLLHTQFETRKDVIKHAKLTFQRLQLKGMLYIGDYATAQPQQVLIAPPSVFEKAKEENRLWRETEKLYSISDDPWKAGYGKQMDDLTKQWEKLWPLK